MTTPDSSLQEEGENIVDSLVQLNFSVKSSVSVPFSPTHSQVRGQWYGWAGPLLLHACAHLISVEP